MNIDQIAETFNAQVVTTGRGSSFLAPARPLVYVCRLCGHRVHLYAKPTVVWCEHKGKVPNQKPCPMEPEEKGNDAA